MCTTILHISDLHFGKPLEAPNDRLLCTPEGAKSLADKVFRSYYQINEAPSIDALIVTGDMTDSARPEEFSLASVFIKHLMEWFTLNSSRLLIIPGNHDVDWNVKDLEQGAQYESFSQFYKGIKGKDWKHDQPDVVEYPMFGTEDCGVLFGFNSCSVENKLWRGLGYVRPGQMDFAKTWLEDREQTQYSLRIAALHHHIFPVHGYEVSHGRFAKFFDEKKEDDRPPISIMLNASNFLRNCSNFGINTILHGHSHAQFIASKTRYFQPYDEGVEQPRISSRSVVVIGSGSASNKNADEFNFTQFQLISFHQWEKLHPFIEIQPHVSRAGAEALDDANARQSIIVPVALRSYEINPVRIAELRTAMNSIVSREYFPEMYDSILRIFAEWLTAIHGIHTGSATIAQFVPGLDIYRIKAIHNYHNPEIRNIVYDVHNHDDRPGITVMVARRNTTIIVPRRKKCTFSTEKYERYYKGSIGGRDQSVIAVPLNAANESYPYAILSFARAWYGKENEFCHRDKSILLDVVDILEDGLRKADLAEQAHKKTMRLRLFRRLTDISDNLTREDPKGLFYTAIDAIKSHLDLRAEMHEAIAVVLPVPNNSEEARPVAQFGFDECVRRMSYSTKKPKGLSDGVLVARKPDYSLDHLKPGKKSDLLGSECSRMCLRNENPVVDHSLSFIGVPLGLGNGQYNKGAIVINIATPTAITNPKDARDYFENEYLDPLMIIAKLLEPLVENVWVPYCAELEVGTQSVQHGDHSKARKKAKKRTRKANP